MMQSGGFLTGRLDTSIGALARTHAGLISQFAFVMVSSIDSMTDLRAIPLVARLLESHPDGRFLGTALMLPGGDIGSIAQELNVFNGFDELWCFDKKPVLVKPTDLWIVAPLQLERDVLPASLASWMMRSECQLGLGDGGGLNYVTPKESIAASLDRIARSA